MNKHVCSLGFLCKHLVAGFEEGGEVEGLVVDCGDVEVFYVFGHGLGHVFALHCGDHCANLVFCMQ